MSNDLENTDLFKVPFYSKELLTVVEKSFDGKISPENAIKEVKNIISSEDISTEDLTSALDFLHNFVEDKNLAKDVMDVIDIATKHSQAGHTSGTNEEGQYYEVDSNVEARNLSTEILKNHPEMEDRVFEVYERVSKTGLPIYHDLAYISSEHPRAINLFLQKHNTDNYEDSLYRAADAMRYLLDNNKGNPEVMLAVGRMVDSYHRRKNKLQGYNRILPDKYKEIMTPNLKEKIEQLRLKSKINSLRKEEKRKNVDRLEQKMRFIEKKVDNLKKQNTYQNGASSDTKRQMEDAARIAAYKEFTTQSK